MQDPQETENDYLSKEEAAALRRVLAATREAASCLSPSSPWWDAMREISTEISSELGARRMMLVPPAQRKMISIAPEPEPQVRQSAP